MLTLRVLEWLSAAAAAQVRGVREVVLFICSVKVIYVGFGLGDLAVAMG